jgi:putative aldouronate transport system permease protein
MKLKKEAQAAPKRNLTFLQKCANQKTLIAMVAIPVIIKILFAYVPLLGWVMAFQNYKPSKGIFDQEWVGLDKFRFLFSDNVFLTDIRNTLAMSFINLVLGFVTAIVLALILNEVKNMFFKRTIQTISYMPHFLSWVIVAGIVQNVLSTDSGIVNDLLLRFGLIDSKINFLGETKYFWTIVGVSNVWKEVGWNTIIYLAAMSAIDTSLYEAASIDGAGRYKKMWHITIPAIKSTFVILLIMNIGHILEAGFEVQYLLGTGPVQEVSETIDIFVLKYGLQKGDYGLATAAGIFKSIISVVLVFSANWISGKLGEEKLI